MKNKAKVFFSKKEQNEISEAIKRAEAVTSGEIAVMVVEESDSYREAATLGSIIISAFVSLCVTALAAFALHHSGGWSMESPEYFRIIVHDIMEYSNIWIFIPLTAVLYFPFRLIINRFPELRILFLSRKRLEEAVRERSVRAFYEKELYKTREENGVLIFISMLEHRVWVLGDRGVNEKIPAEFWQERAKELSRGMKENNCVGAVIDAIEKFSNEMKVYFPIQPDDVNELPDEILTE